MLYVRFKSGVGTWRSEGGTVDADTFRDDPAAPQRGEIVRVNDRLAIVLQAGFATTTVVYLKGAIALPAVITKISAAFWGGVEQVDVIQQAQLGSVVGRVSTMAMDKLELGLQVLQTLM